MFARAAAPSARPERRKPRDMGTLGLWCCWFAEMGYATGGSCGLNPTWVVWAPEPHEECSAFVAAAMNIIVSLARQRGIRRLCHFTRLSSLQQMVLDGCIKASADLSLDLVNDQTRADGHRAFVCCSIMYPNVFLLNSFAEDLDNWCVLLLRPELLGGASIRFCPVNAAREWGRFVQVGRDGFEALYQDEVVSGNKLLRRTPRQPRSVPTDNQAEVLIGRSVPIGQIFEIVLPSEAAGKQARAIIADWHPAEKPPMLRVESRMFRPDSYWDSGLFADSLPIGESK